MATINASLPTLADLASRLDPNGAVAKIAEVLEQNNPAIKDIPWQEGNLTTGHVFTSRFSLPTPTWRRLNQGVAPGKSRTTQVTETCGMLEAMSKVDCALAKLSGNEAAFRATEDRAHIQGMGNEFESALFYASLASTPEQITGFSPRLAVTTGTWGGQIVLSDIAASGSDQSSMWLVCWGPDTVFGIYPKGTMAGIQQYDGGKQLTLDSGGTNEFWAYVTSWSWNVGLCVKDARYLVRLANIDTSAIVGTGKLLVTSMVKATKQAHDLKTGRPVFYCNRKIETYLHLQALDMVGNSTLSIDSIGGKPQTNFLGIPIRVTDELTNTEAVVS